MRSGCVDRCLARQGTVEQAANVYLVAAQHAGLVVGSGGAEHRAEALDAFGSQAGDGVRRHVARRQAGTAGRDHHVDGGVVAPPGELVHDRVDLVGDHDPRDTTVSEGAESRLRQRAGGVGLERA